MQHTGKLSLLINTLLLSTDISSSAVAATSEEVMNQKSLRGKTISKTFFVMLLSISFLVFGNQSMWANDTSIAGTPRCSTHELTTDEVDEVMQAAKAAIAIINQDLKAKNDHVLSLITKNQALITQSTGEDAAIAAQIDSKLKSVAAELAKIKVEKETIREEIAAISAVLARLEEQKVSLRKLLVAKTNEIAGKEAAAAQAADAALAAARAANARPVLIAISHDRMKAAKFIEFVRGNSRTALSEMLKREAPGSDVDVREVKDTNGLLAIFRINGLTHCLSTKQQCGGKAYSVTK